MSVLQGEKRYVWNRTRNACLATDLSLAATHWTRFRGLMCAAPESFGAGQALWIVPCKGVHTFAMRFPIDVVYLDRDQRIVHLEPDLKPWRLAPVRMRAVSVLELPQHTLSSTRTAIGDQVEIATGQQESNPA